jgi:hypothetical protein
VLGETSSRPFMVLGLAGAVGISAIGAVLGYSAAKAANAAGSTRGLGHEMRQEDGSGARRLASPRVAPGADGGVRIELARVSF